MADKQGELFPEDKSKKKPSTNPRAVSARRKRAQKKSDIANQAENERVLNRQRKEWDEYNKQVERNRSKLRTPNIDPEDDWQTNPAFDREKGGWNALTISNAALKARQLFRLGAGLGGFARSLMIKGNY